MLDFEKIPGDSHLVEVEKHSENGQEVVEGGEIVLIPKPSDDPNDPLNWTPWRKRFHMFCIVVYVFGLGVPTTVIYSVLADIEGSTNIPLSSLNDGTGYMFLFLGIGCIFYLPMSLQYGKRPFYLLSSLACCLISVWQPYASTEAAWIGSKILQGFVASACEALPEVTVSDVFFEHERATWMGVYALALFASNYLSPMLSGFVNKGLGWHWVIYLSCIWNAVSFLFILFFLEESGYNRSQGSVEEVSDSKNSSITEEKALPKVKVENLAGEDEVHIGERILNESIPVRSLLQRMGFYRPTKEFNLAYYFWGPFQMLQFPIVLWSGFLYGATLIWYSVMNGTLSSIFSASPYNFSSSMVGLVYLSPLIFAVIFYFYAGWTLDYLKIFIARRRNGHSKAEDRLWALTLYIILCPSALILWGVGAYHHIHWFGLVIGCGLMGGLATIGCSVSVTYAVDTYREMSCEAMVVVIMVRNCMSFGVNYGITPWVEGMGLQNAFIAAAFICLGTIGTFLLMIATGPYWRKKSRNSYWKLVAKKESLVGIH